MKVKKYSTFWFLFAAIVYLELILKAFTSHTFFDIGLLIMPLFSMVTALVLSCIFSRVKQHIAKHITTGILAFLTLLYAAQLVYYKVFSYYFELTSIIAGGIGQITEGGIIGNTFNAILSGLPAIILLSVPLVVYILFGFKRLKYRRMKWQGVALLGVTAICLHIAITLIISVSGNLSSIQSGDFTVNFGVSKFGLIRTEMLDFKYNILGIEQDIDVNTEDPNLIDTVTPTPPPTENTEPIDTSPNIIDIDFTALSESTSNKQLKTLNQYFGNKQPTLKNHYTGMYEGYNLITITAEGFSHYAIHPELTPTLYKMYNDGFKFTNFYTPWLGSTSAGEYAACTGLLPASSMGLKLSGSKYYPYTLGNIFQSIGVDKTFAYHNHTYSYYNRHLSHPNMGYTYYGWGNGIEKYVKKRWPESDLEMIAGSTKDYLSDNERFHAYYMTVSGHYQYSFSGNSMSSKNKDLVKHLDGSDAMKAYYACNIELDRAMEQLLKDLNAAGVADKTVITITPDHHPYGLEQEGDDKYSVWREFLGHNVETTFELYESVFLLYCQGTKDAPTVDKPCSTVDVLPTILNLFGIEYDSRLLIGTDIMSTTDCIAQLHDRSFVSSKGKYNAKTKEFTLHEGQSFASQEEQDTYVKQVKDLVANRFKMSKAIFDNDYYRHVFSKK